MDATVDDSEELRHGHFRDLCMLYGDFNRPVFLEEVLIFLRSANKEEIATIRRSGQRRTEILRHGGRRGRPRAHDDPDWLHKAFMEIWQKEILGWTWQKIASEAGMEPSKPNIRTLQ
jgi:hypothetical protein